MRSFLPHIIALSALWIISLAGAAQNITDNGLLSSAAYREQFELSTDRVLYASGEQVFFRIFNCSPVLLRENNWSRVIYVDLVNGNNKRVASAKYPLEGEQGAYGRFPLPDTLSTGAFYLRAYTRWMRNFHPSGYAHQLLLVINPQQKSLPGSVPAEYAGGVARPAGNSPHLSCVTSKSAYGKREQATAEISLNDADASPGGYSLAVIRKGSCLPNPEPVDDRVGDTAFTRAGNLYVPESQGISLAGRVVDPLTGNPVPEAHIYLTLLGQQPDCLGYQTDSAGTLLLSLPTHSGSQDILITPDPDGDQAMKIHIADEFSDEFIAPPEWPAGLTQACAEQLEETIIHAQVGRTFPAPAENKDSSSLAQDNQPFYGRPDVRYRTEDYILLPNLREFFYELIPNVYLKSRDGKRFFEIHRESGTPIYHAPLVLLDFVPVLDASTILSVSPRDIAYIDIVNSLYIRGLDYYGGIISIISKEGDRAGVRLPEQAQFFTFSTFHESHNEEGRFRDQPDWSPGRPDLRSRLLWIPDLDLVPGVTEKIEFSTSDVSGTYEIVITGVNARGRIIRHHTEFSVR